MTRAIGMLVGTLLMLGVFLLVLSAGHSPTLLREVVNSEADTNPAVTGLAAAKEVPVENSVDSPELADCNAALAASRSGATALSGILLKATSSATVTRLAPAASVPCGDCRTVTASCGMSPQNASAIVANG